MNNRIDFIIFGLEMNLMWILEVWIRFEVTWKKEKGFYLIPDEKWPKLGVVTQLAIEMACLVFLNSDRVAGSLQPMSGEAGPREHAHRARPACAERGTGTQCMRTTEELAWPSVSNGGPSNDKVFTNSCT
jgi:hypothetical protein